MTRVVAQRPVRPQRLSPAGRREEPPVPGATGGAERPAGSRWRLTAGEASGVPLALAAEGIWRGVLGAARFGPGLICGPAQPVPKQGHSREHQCQGRGRGDRAGAAKRRLREDLADPTVHGGGGVRRVPENEALGHGRIGRARVDADAGHLTNEGTRKGRSWIDGLPAAERLALAWSAYNAETAQTAAMPARLSRPLLRSGFVVALVVVFALAMLPLPAPITVVSFQDKIEHCLAFVALTLLGQAGWPARTARIAGGLVLYGVLIELVQHWLTAHRVGDPLDALANSIGVAVGVGIALRVARGDDRGVVR